MNGTVFNQRTNKASVRPLTALGLSVTLALASTTVAAKELADVKDAYRPALNLPQSIEWAKKRPVGSLYALRASDVIGQPVFNGEGNEIGEVDDIVISNSEDRRTLAIIEVGGFLGIGDKHVAIPYTELRVSKDTGDGVFLNLTEKQLLSLSEFVYEEGEKTGKQKLLRNPT